MSMLTKVAQAAEAILIFQKEASWGTILGSLGVAGVGAGAAYGMHDSYKQLKAEGDKLRNLEKNFRKDVPKYLLAAAAGGGAGAFLTNAFSNKGTTSPSVSQPEANKTLSKGTSSVSQQPSSLAGLLASLRSESAQPKFSSVTPDYLNRLLEKESSLGKFLGVGTALAASPIAGYYGMRHYMNNYNKEYSEGLRAVKDGAGKMEKIHKWAPLVAAGVGAATGGIGTHLYNNRENT